MIGGIIAAPFAALLVKKLKPAVLGVLADGLIVMTNLKTIAQEFFSVLTFYRTSVLLLPLLVVWGLMLVFAIRKKVDENELNAKNQPQKTRGFDRAL